MSESDVETTKEAWAALQRGDQKAFLELCDPDIEFKSLVAEAEGGAFRGHDGVREWWKEVVESLGGLRYDTDEPIDLGDGLILTRVVISGRVANVEVPQTMWHLADIREGRAIGWSVFRGEDEARRAAQSRPADG